MRNSRSQLLYKLSLFIFLLFALTCNLLAHKNFWDIKATAIPEEESISFSIFLSLEQLNEFFKSELKLKEYRPEIKQQLIEKLVTLAPQILSLKEGEDLLNPFVKKVEVYIDESLLEEKSLSLSSVDIDLELIYFTNANKVYGSWNLYADSLIKQNTSDISKVPKGAFDVNIYFLDEHQSKISVNSKSKKFIWERQKSTEMQPLQAITVNTTVEEKAAYLPAILVLTAIVFWAFSLGKIANSISILLVVSSALLITFPISNSSKVISVQKMPDEKAIQAFMNNALKKIYLSTTTKNKKFKWEFLSEILTDKLKEKVFIANYSMEEGVIQHFVESIKIDSIQQITETQVECSWQTATLFQHISHIHEKTISFKGVFHFELHNKRWLISDVNIRRNL